MDEWLTRHLFPDGFFDPAAFPAGATLYRRADPRPYLEAILHQPQILAPFPREELYRELMKACGVLGLKRSARLFQVNVHDNLASELERSFDYPYPLGDIGPPLMYLYQLLEEHPAMEGGTSYVGLLGYGRDWLLLLELENDFSIAAYGSEEFCRKLREGLGLVGR